MRGVGLVEGEAEVDWREPGSNGCWEVRVIGWGCVGGLANRGGIVRGLWRYVERGRHTGLQSVRVPTLATFLCDCPVYIGLGS